MSCQLSCCSWLLKVVLARLEKKVLLKSPVLMDLESARGELVQICCVTTSLSLTFVTSFQIEAAVENSSPNLQCENSPNLQCFHVVSLKFTA